MFRCCILLVFSLFLSCACSASTAQVSMPTPIYYAHAGEYITLADSWQIALVSMNDHEAIFSVQQFSGTDRDIYVGDYFHIADGDGNTVKISCNHIIHFPSAMALNVTLCYPQQKSLTITFVTAQGSTVSWAYDATEGE